MPNGRDECGPYGTKYQPGSSADCDPRQVELQLPSTAELGRLVKDEGISKSGDATAGISASLRLNFDDARLCKISYDEEVGCAFIPCRYVVACVKCALEITFYVLCQKFRSIRIFDIHFTQPSRGVRAIKGRNFKIMTKMVKKMSEVIRNG